MSAPRVAVWTVALDAHRPPDRGALAELSAGERIRAERFATDSLRNRWLGGHVALRRILAQRLGVAPAAITYGRTATDKPFLAAPTGTGLEFNFSDAGDLALVALSEGGAVGVDVEACRPERDLERIAESFFAKEERAALRAVPAGERADAYYRIWARKEAFIKAIGIGLGFPLAAFAVSSEAEAPRLLRIDPDARAAGSWQLANVPVPHGYAAAIVVPAGEVRFEWNAWNP